MVSRGPMGGPHSHQTPVQPTPPLQPSHPGMAPECPPVGTARAGTWRSLSKQEEGGAAMGPPLSTAHSPPSPRWPAPALETRSQPGLSAGLCSRPWWLAARPGLACGCLAQLATGHLSPTGLGHSPTAGVMLRPFPHFQLWLPDDSRPLKFPRVTCRWQAPTPFPLLALGLKGHSGEQARSLVPLSRARCGTRVSVAPKARRPQKPPPHTAPVLPAFPECHSS